MEIISGKLYKINKYDFANGEGLFHFFFDDEYYPYKYLIANVVGTKNHKMVDNITRRLEYFWEVKLLAGIRFGEVTGDGTHMVRERHLQDLNNEDVFHLNDKWGDVSKK